MAARVLPLATLDIFPILGAAFPLHSWKHLDLSVNNPTIANRSIHDTAGFEQVILDMKKESHALVGWGGYLEHRGWYQRAEHFGNADEARTIHLGIDLWVAGNTPLYAPLDGKIHSIKDNALYGDYGPTIILEHNIDGSTFHSLYGHLTKESLDNKQPGDIITRGSQFAAIGTPPTNGDWPPHLHLQIIHDMEGMQGDYPGVCSKSKLSWYKENCPDPSLLLFPSER